MKLWSFSLLFLLFAFLPLSQAQTSKVAYLDMNKILESVPEYSKAQTELEQLAERWRQEMAKEYDKIDAMYKEYQAREPLLNEEMRKQKQDEIVNKEKALRDLQKARFGPEGELFQKRQSLVRPVQEQVYKAIESFASKGSYDFILSAPDGSTVIYAKGDRDVTNDIIKILGN